MFSNFLDRLLYNLGLSNALEDLCTFIYLRILNITLSNLEVCFHIWLIKECEDITLDHTHFS